VRVGFLKSGQPDKIHEFPDGIPLLLENVPCPQPEGYVVVDVQPREQVRVLEHKSAVAVWSGYLLAVEVYRAFRRLVKACKQPQHGGFSAAGRSDKADEISLFYFQIHSVERMYDLPVGTAEALLHAAEFYCSYHLMTPFCHSSTLSLTLKRTVITR